MKLKIIDEKYNPLMKRKEVNVEFIHQKAGTPDRVALRKDLVNECKSKESNLYIINVLAQTGTNKSLCYAEIYDDADYSRKVVPKHIINRNFPPKEEEKPKEKEIPPKEKGPANKPPEEKPPKEEAVKEGAEEDKSVKEKK